MPICWVATYGFTFGVSFCDEHKRHWETNILDNEVNAAVIHAAFVRCSAFFNRSLANTRNSLRVGNLRLQQKNTL